MAGIFKAYDVRGTVPGQFNEAIARKIGLEFHNILAEDDLAHGRAVISSLDMRSHSPGLQAALIEGLLFVQSLVLGGILLIFGFVSLLIGVVADLIAFNRSLLEILLEKVRTLEISGAPPAAPRNAERSRDDP